jgi:hypothetical protein
VLAEPAALQVQEHLVLMVLVPYLVLLLQLGAVVVPLFQTLQDIQVVQAVVAVVLEEDQPVAVAELQVKVLPAVDQEVAE